MLQAIKIENYRGIRIGEVPEFGMVNLIVGPNGSGKSTLLEAIFHGAARHNPHFHDSQGYSLLGRRHNEMWNQSEQHPTYPPSMWYGKRQDRTIRLQYRFAGGEPTWEMEPPAPPAHRASTSWRLGPNRAATLDYFSDRGLNEPMEYFSKLRLLDVRTLLDKEVETSTWDQLLNVRGDRVLKDVMSRVYDLRIENFSYSVNPPVLKVLLDDRPFALNVDDLGAGMRITLRFLVVMILTGGSGVLVEEFDGYQHPQALVRAARALVQLAEKTKTQLFLATHSIESVRWFVEAAGETPGADVRVIQTRLSTDGQFDTAILKADAARTLLDAGDDLRRVGG